MTVNTQELREALAALNAEAGIDAWCDMGDDIYENAPDGVSPIPETDQRFIVQANPATVSALLDEIDALRAELQARQWQPIETAPHETLVVLGWYESGVFKQEIALASAGERYPDGYSNRWWHGRATHWMPLPPDPPQGETA